LPGTGDRDCTLDPNQFPLRWLWQITGQLPRKAFHDP
jgi:hypothetical protein